MASDARINTGLPAHPKTKKVIRRLGEAGAWYTVCLILWTAANRSDGDLTGMSSEEIELAVDWRGQPDAFVKALAECRLLDGEEGAYRLHDWAEHNPWAAGADARSEKSKFAALCKQHGRKEAARLMPEYARRIDFDSQEQGKVLPDSASGTKKPASSTAKTSKHSASGTNGQCQILPVASNSSAPSPSPSPSPSPRAEEREKQTGGEKPKRQAKPDRTLADWIASLPDGEMAIPETDPVFQSAERAGLPDEFVALEWAWFKRKYSPTAKRYRDWRQVFRNAVDGAWGSL
jgi:hypothetical protein